MHKPVGWGCVMSIFKRKKRKKKEAEVPHEDERMAEIETSIPLGGLPDVELVEVKCPKCGYTTEVFEYDPDHPPLCPKDKTPLKPI